jgi:outer membrane protein assembly factor BamB
MRGIASMAIVAAALGASCGGPQTAPKLFSTEWEDDGGATIENVRKKLGSARPARGADVAVAVAGNADKLVGIPLSGGAKWTFAHPLDARPVITGSIVVGSGGGEIFALDALTGRKIWVRDSGGLQLRGAGDDGAVTAITFTRQGGNGSSLLAVTRDGKSVQQIETDKQLGVPAVLQGLAFVPWASQYVSVIDLSSGDEAARVTFREKVSRAWTVGEGLFFGEVGFFRFDEKIRGASRNMASHAGLPHRELPGNPLLMFSGEEREHPTSNARDRIRLYARPTGPASALMIEGGIFYATYFRLVLGLDVQQGQIRWVHTHAANVIGGGAASGSLSLCDDQGKITFIDEASGGVSGERDLGEPLKSCAVQADGFVAPRATSDERLADQLEKAVTSPDADLSTAQRILLRDLGVMPDESATRVLVHLASDPRTPPDIKKDARAALALRRNGATFMLDALALRFDYLKDVLLAPPVAPIAKALAAMNDARGAGPLALHLLDPADTEEDVREAAAAMLVLATAAELPLLEQFFAMYRGVAQGPDMEGAVVHVAKTILRLGDKKGRAQVEAASKDAMTTPAIKSQLEPLFAPPPSVDGGAPSGDGGAAATSDAATTSGDAARP